MGKNVSTKGLFGPDKIDLHIHFHEPLTVIIKHDGGLSVDELVIVDGSLDEVNKLATKQEKGENMSKALDDTLAKIAETKTKVLALQQAIKDGGMSAAEETKVNDALTDLSQTADPTVPNP